MKVLVVILPFIIAIALGRVIIPYILFISYRKRLFDPLDLRKSHHQITPRLGGVAFAPVQSCLFILSVVILYKVNFVALGINTAEIFPMFTLLLCGMVILFLVGLADDLVGVSYRWKFMVQIFVAALFPLSGLWINDLYGILFITYLPIWAGVPLTIFAVVLIINAVNLIDGIDGLCSGLIMVGCLFLGVLFTWYDAWLHALFAFITAGVLVSFFYFNVFGAFKRRRRIFMGDTGSLTLGYSIAFLSISFAMNNEDIKPFSEGAIVTAFSALIVPVFDVSRVLFVRWRDKQPLFKADRNHLHHKFLRSGMSHHNAMISILLLALFFCLFNFFAVQYISNNVVVLCDVLLWVAFLLTWNMIEYRKKRVRAQKIQFLND
ncbi:MraY family glycosyltransferase [Sphingobacterium paludis]|uniref:UDP-N-acetylmuramyl pentapeptide phosphotransferase/UDP-N-acetylglucosamine-1-phosphate transferase n=1 Tax=Sphingobacterium paludis TaxID=1476465 RepID=A0A4R7D2G7_9SPHI|nr:MraY family glycosyltransferase [Sphingobacterium paludis]TDS13774.1 UDP-N-acetylmuramyl pentapeptide phosphotransferase/UDP-N-acetylglucosamine-1-phosphate transferase [Sphingobacterium paludis]